MTAPLVYGTMTPAEGQSVFMSNFPFATTVQKLTLAIESAGLWIVHTIDPQALLARENIVMRQARQILFFHPRYMAKLLEANPSGIMEVPLKFIVLEMSDDSVAVLAPTPRLMLSKYEGLETLGAELSVVCETIIKQFHGS